MSWKTSNSNVEAEVRDQLNFASLMDPLAPTKYSSDVARHCRMASSFQIGSLILKGRALLSPLEAVSDVGFRQLCHSQGAALTFTEMIRAQGLLT